MADGTNNGIDMGGQGVLNAQIYSDSTAKYPFEPNPVGNFNFSGREDVVTVKDIEEIVKTVRDCFENFINVQRSYLDRRSQTSSNENSVSSDELADGDSSTTANQSNSYGLTEQANFDIIKEEVSKDISSSKDEILKNISDIHTDIFTKIENIPVNISEKLIESNTEDENEEGLDSFIEFMSSSIDDVKSLISNANSSTESLKQNSLSNGSVEVFENPLKDNSTFEKDNDEKLNENDELDGEKLVYQISENINERIDEHFEVEKSSLVDKIDKDIESIGNSIVDLSTTIFNSTSDGMENMMKSITDMLVQDSSMQMMLSETVDGITEPIVNNVSTIPNIYTEEKVEKSPIELNSSETLVKNISTGEIELSTIPSSNMESMKVPDITEIPDSEFDDVNFDYGIVPEKVGSDGLVDILTSSISNFMDTIHGFFGKSSKEENINVENGALSTTSLNEMVGERTITSPVMQSVQQPSIDDSTNNGLGIQSQSAEPSQTSMEMLMEGIKENREYNGNRFDKLESMLEKKLNEPPVHTETMTIPDNRQIFEVERIH